MAEKKVTKRDRFLEIKALLEKTDKPELIAFIDHELELLAKKNASDKKPTKTQVANEALKEVILTEMADNTLYTITEMQKKFPALAELSNQRVSALVRALIADNKVERIEDKRKAYFKKIVG